MPWLRHFALQLLLTPVCMPLPPHQIVGMVTFVAGLLFGIHTKYKNDVMHLYIGVGVLSVIVAVVGLWGATKLSPNKMKLVCQCINRRTAVVCPVLFGSPHTGGPTLFLSHPVLLSVRRCWCCCPLSILLPSSSPSLTRPTWAG